MHLLSATTQHVSVLARLILVSRAPLLFIFADEGQSVLKTVCVLMSTVESAVDHLTVFHTTALRYAIASTTRCSYDSCLQLGCMVQY